MHVFSANLWMESGAYLLPQPRYEDISCHVGYMSVIWDLRHTSENVIKSAPYFRGYNSSMWDNFAQVYTQTPLCSHRFFHLVETKIVRPPNIDQIQTTQNHRLLPQNKNPQLLHSVFTHFST